MDAADLGERTGCFTSVSRTVHISCKAFDRHYTNPNFATDSDSRESYDRDLLTAMRHWAGTAFPDPGGPPGT